MPPRYRLHLGLFVATCASVLLVGINWAEGWRVEEVGSVEAAGKLPLLELVVNGWVFAVPLMAILVCHELGHWVAARIHRVDASLPYFIPLPFVGPLGTLGAVIAMRGRIRSRNALLDIGAAGPVAGMVVAVPVLAIGLAASRVVPQSTEGYIQEGQSLLYLLMKRVVVGPIPDGHDVYLHPTALAGWAGLLLTMINMLPWGQLDGGHIAYALFGERQNRAAGIVRAMLVPLFLYNLAIFVVPVLQGRTKMTLGVALMNSTFWLVWLILTGVMSKFGAGRHPPTDPGPLTTGRRLVAVLTLILFAGLFMPTPMAVYE